jgi:hypothetical protein
MPASALNSFVTITQTDTHEFYEPAHAIALLGNNQKNLLASMLQHDPLSGLTISPSTAVGK